MARKDTVKGSTQAGQLGAEQPAGDGAEQAPPDGGLDAATRAGPAAMASPQDEPGPEEFDRHTGARLIADHERDLALVSQAQKRIEKRADVIATRARAKGGANAIVVIGDTPFAPRQRQAKLGGGMMLVELSKRSEPSLD